MTPDASGKDRGERAVLAKAVSRLFDEWNLQTTDRAALLGLNQNSRATLGRYAGGEPLANSRDLLDRVGHLLSIYRMLALIFPENPEIRSG